MRKEINSNSEKNEQIRKAREEHRKALKVFKDALSWDQLQGAARIAEKWGLSEDEQNKAMDEVEKEEMTRRRRIENIYEEEKRKKAAEEEADEERRTRMRHLRWRV